eukprot:CAMPEP_0184399210 /NCGR_PEP_ID=MMETSP0007-20130409/69639_1 /TAXON_ID=97485 /ORGANISM="Prymnesium parvum, Strain Texoma1" /LENGTH=112 /DNA_ID=CAMNT_0026753575 /DNA_START=190 /DNA_END=525 /DNA_ORIENTATION=-
MQPLSYWTHTSFYHRSADSVSQRLSRINESLYCSLRRSLQDAVSKIEDVPLAALPDALAHTLANLLVGAEEERRVNVPLQHAVGAKDLSCFRHIHSPIDRQSVARHVGLLVE